MIDPVAYKIAASLGVLMIPVVLALYTGRIHWLTKAVLAVLAFTMLVAVYVTMAAALGWPVVEATPATFRLVWADIHEPQGQDPGRIYVWLVPPGTDQPRAISLPYTQADHEALQRAKARIEKGEDVYLERRGGSAREPQGHGIQRGGDPSFDFVPPPSTVPSKRPA